MTKENIEEIKVAYNEFVKVVGFKCLGCGKCGCIRSNTNKLYKPILIINEEMEVLKKKGKLYGILPYNSPNGLRKFGFGGALRFENFKCSFFTEDNKCDIHEYKPLICFLHPFQVFTVGFAFGGGMIFDTKCSWVKKNRSKLDKPSKCILDAYNKLYSLVMEYKINLGFK